MDAASCPCVVVSEARSGADDGGGGGGGGGESVAVGAPAHVHGVAALRYAGQSLSLGCLLERHTKPGWRVPRKSHEKRGEIL